MNKQRLSLLLLLTLVTAAAAAILRRRQEPPDGPSLLPMPEPPEPPRIVLPQSVVEEKEWKRQAEPEVEAPLRERAVGEQPESSAAGQASEATQATSRSSQGARGGAKSGKGDEQILGYCMHCRERRPIAEGEEVITDSGRRALSGSCPECGTRIFRFLPSKEKK